MLLTIEHKTTYQFSEPQRLVVQSQRMYPATFAGQKVIEWEVSAESAIFGQRFTDGAGDQIQTMTVMEPGQHLEIVARGQVKTRDTAGVLKDHHEIISPLVYLRSTKLTQTSELLQALAAQVSGDNQLDQAHMISALVSENISYQPGSTHSEVTAAQALQQGKGVCQDQAHCLIALAKIRNIPARYVTGYLLFDAQGLSHGASHAWVELYIADLGWVGFDATNQCCPDERYVRIGSGLDAHAAALIRGATIGEAVESLQTKVVVEHDTQQAQQ